MCMLGTSKATSLKRTERPLQRALCQLKVLRGLRAHPRKVLHLRTDNGGHADMDLQVEGPSAMQRKAATRTRLCFQAVHRGQTSKEPNSSTTSSRGSDVKNSPTCAKGTRILVLQPERQDQFCCKWLAATVVWTVHIAGWD